jgi:type IV pilus assembly protein PilE
VRRNGAVIVNYGRDFGNKEIARKVDERHSISDRRYTAASTNTGKLSPTRRIIFMRTLSATRATPANSGFTLIELMVAVVIISILARIALPIYRNYVVSGEITEATTALAGLRAKMEQYYQDNRTYSNAGSTSTPIYSPCDNTSTSTVGLVALNGTLKYFQVTCPTSGYTNNWATTSATAYTLVATGNSGALTNGFTYTLDNQNNQSSTTSSTSLWGSLTCSSTWLTSKGRC